MEYETDKQMVTWFVCVHELDDLQELKSSDEFMAIWEPTIAGVVTGEPWVVIVLRDGTVTNRTYDDTVTVPEHVRVMAGEETMLYRDVLGEQEMAQTVGTLAVNVDMDGKFAGVDEASLQALKGGGLPTP